MDTSDPGILFDNNGICNRCRDYEITRDIYVPPASIRQQKLNELVDQVKREGRSKEYDCVIGVSGGVDSTYLAYLAKRKLGLRPLAVHMDNGWNSELAVANIQSCLNTLEIDLYTKVLDWDEFRDLQLAFLKASTPDSEIPTDHAILAVLMKTAAEIGVRYIVWGANIVTEGLAVPTWSMGAYDWKYIRSVHQQFGTVPLTSFPHFSLRDLFYYRVIKRQKTIMPLNYIEYRKNDVEETLVRELGWRPYSGKHHESIYTRFFQAYILPQKFGYDKRKAHFSTLVMSGQMTREDALEHLKVPLYDPELLTQDRKYVVKKLGISENDLDYIMRLPIKSFYDYPSYESTQLVRMLRGYRRRTASGPVSSTSAKVSELVGDSFSPKEIARWYEQEASYHDQFKGGRANEYWSIYETFNRRYAFDRYFKPTVDSKVLSFGCAEGIDLEKTWRQFRFQLYGIEASLELMKEFQARFPNATIRRATVTGTIDYDSDFFDYVTVLGVLHHIPNVSFVLKEIHRVVKPGGLVIIREPSTNMRTPKNPFPITGSPNERGIPKDWMQLQLQKLGFHILIAQPSFYGPLMRIVSRYRFFWRHSDIVWIADSLLSRLPHTDQYCHTRFIDKLAPGAVYYVVQK